MVDTRVIQKYLYFSDFMAKAGWYCYKWIGGCCKSLTWECSRNGRAVTGAGADRTEQAPFPIQKRRNGRSTLLCSRWIQRRREK
jgi:hypothetical protein